MKKKRLIMEWLHSCSGCEISLLDLGRDLLPLLRDMDIRYFPLLSDYKCDQSGQEADIVLVSGGVATEEQKQRLVQLRRHADVLIALGTCATHGGIPALGNLWTRDQLLDTVFSTSSTANPHVPDQDLPGQLDRVYAVDEWIEVDCFLPGCPPSPESIAQWLHNLLEGHRPVPQRKSVCDTCPARRTGRMAKQFHRFPGSLGKKSGQTTGSTRCLLEQGFLCMGPVTAAGCDSLGEPACIAAHVPCRGCFGPVRSRDNQMVGMLNALISQGVDLKTLTDRKSMLRFSGAHGRLRPGRATKKG